MSGSDFREYGALDAEQRATFDELAAQFDFHEEHLVDSSMLPRPFCS